MYCYTKQECCLRTEIELLNKSANDTGSNFKENIVFDTNTKAFLTFFQMKTIYY